MERSIVFIPETKEDMCVRNCYLNMLKEIYFTRQKNKKYDWSYDKCVKYCKQKNKNKKIKYLYI